MLHTDWVYQIEKMRWSYLLFYILQITNYDPLAEYEKKSFFSSYLTCTSSASLPSFDLLTRPNDPHVRHLLNADRHGSHVAAPMVAFCLSRAIDLLMLPPHCSHELQPLHVSVFAPLKRALAHETDEVSQLDPWRLSRFEWREMYIRAREKSLTPSNIRSGWRATCSEPLNPITVFDRLHQSMEVLLSDPQSLGQTSSLDVSLLHSSPPGWTEPRQADGLLGSELRKMDGPALSIKRYTQRLTKVVESTQSELVTIRQQLAGTQALLRTRKGRKRGNRVSLQGKHVFGKEEVHEIAEQAEERTAVKNAHSRRNTPSITKQLRREVPDVSKSDVSEAESNCDVVARRKSSRRSVPRILWPNSRPGHVPNLLHYCSWMLLVVQLCSGPCLIQSSDAPVAGNQDDPDLVTYASGIKNNLSSFVDSFSAVRRLMTISS